MFRILSQRVVSMRGLVAGSPSQPLFKSTSVFAVRSSSFSSTADAQKAQFRHAVLALEKSKAQAKQVSNDTKLQLYAYFKQAEKGPCTGSRPGMFDLVNRAKYDAWKALGDMSSEKAMAEYVRGVTDIFGGSLPTDFALNTEDKAVPTSSPAPSSSSTAIKFKTLTDLMPRSQPTSSLESLAQQMSRIALSVDESSGVGQLKLNRFSKGNAFDLQMWDELLHSWAALQGDKRVRCVVLSGASEGPKSVFSTGMDLSVFVNLQGQLSAIECEGRRREALRDIIIYLQDCVNQCEHLSVPVIAAVSGHCIGAGIDLICAADLRYATKDASFCVKEIDLAIVADMGTVQRLPKLIGHSRAAELCYTGRTFSGVEAQAMGLVLQTFDTEAELQAHVQQVAQEIARKSPLTIRGLKRGLLFSRDHNVQDSLQQVQLWNSAMLQSHDLLTAATSVMQKKTPVYELD